MGTATARFWPGTLAGNAEQVPSAASIVVSVRAPEKSQYSLYASKTSPLLLSTKSGPIGSLVESDVTTVVSLWSWLATTDRVDCRLLTYELILYNRGVDGRPRL